MILLTTQLLFILLSDSEYSILLLFTRCKCWDLMFILYHNFPIFLNSLKNIMNIIFAWYLRMTTVCLSYHQIDSVHPLFYSYKKCFNGHSIAYLYLLPSNKLLEVEQLDKKIWALLRSYIMSNCPPKKACQCPIFFQQCIEDPTFLYTQH